MKLNAITVGDPSGIGPEIALKTLINNEEYRNRTIIIGSREVLLYYSKILNNTIDFSIIKDPAEFKSGSINILHSFNLSMDNLVLGAVSKSSGEAAYKYLEKAINLAIESKIGGIVTAPLNKEALHKAGYKYAGHTEIFAELTNTDKYSMMLWSEKMAVVHVSTHVSLRKAIELVKPERIIECIELADQTMKKMGISTPKIAVAGINPHSGESGLFGNEEVEYILPAINLAKQRGFNVDGPVPPDTVFLKASRGQYDIVIAMYHDQGHIPMKLLAFDNGVNVTLGLPIIRTSVDHGTAFDIAGKGIANEESLVSALKIADRLNN